MSKRRRWLKALGWALVFTVAFFMAVGAWLWQDRPTLDELEVDRWSAPFPHGTVAVS